MKTMISHISAALALGFVATLSAPAAQAGVRCPVTITRPEGALGISCGRPWTDFFVSRYGIDRGDWAPDLGRDECDGWLQWSRTMNAIYILNYGDSAAGGKNTADFSGTILRWAGNFSMEHVDSIEPSCQDKSIVAESSILFGGITLYHDFFYSSGPAVRAGMLLHEARHTNMCSHNGNDGSPRCPARSSSCDESISDGCSLAAGNVAGAFGFEVDWYEQYLRAAHSGIINAEWRAEVAAEANFALNNFFDRDPCFNLTTSGARVSVCKNGKARW